MVFEKIVCDRCKSEMSHPEGRRIWLSGVGREGGYDLCNACYYDLFHWFFEPNGYVVIFNRGEVNADED
jgi:hypothetical protein